MNEEANNILSRRKFVATTASASVAALASASLQAKPNTGKAPAAETLVQSLYESLDDKQREAICLPFEHPLRSNLNSSSNY